MKLAITSRTIQDEAGQPRNFQYALLIDEIEVGSFICESYGVCVQEEDATETRIPNITTSISRIEELIRLLVEHQVSPTTAQDVVDDWL